MEEKSKDYEERRGRGRGRGRGRPRGRAKAPPRGLRVKKRNMIESEEEEEQPPPDENQPPKAKQYDQDCDISSLEAPTFTTLDRGPPAPMLRLSWDHPVNLIGEKVLSPRIHICDSCNKPILIYGRMIPCKHVFCLWCAKSEDRVCARCGERVARVEQTGLGTVFMCNYTINKAVCKRTYLSQRDLQAHIDHRHMKMSGAAGGPKEDLKEERLSHRDPRGEGRDQRGDPRGEVRPDPRGMNDPRVGKEGYEGHRDSFAVPPQFPRQGGGVVPGQYGAGASQAGPHQSPSGHQGASHISMIPVMTTARTNLITVPIQDPPDHSPSFPPTHGPPSHLPTAHSFTSPPPPATHSQQPHSAHSQPHSTHSQPHSTHSQPHSGHQQPHPAHPQPHSTHPQPHSAHTQPHSTHPQPHSAHSQPHSSHSQPHSSHSQPHSQPHSAHPQPHSAHSQPHSSHSQPHSGHSQSHSAHSQPHSGHSQPHSAHSSHSQPHSGHSQSHSTHSQGHSSHSQPHSGHSQAHSSHSQPHSSHSQPHSQSSTHPHPSQPSQQYATSLASLSSAYTSQTGQYTYPPTPSAGPPPNPNVPPPPYSNVAPPPTTFAGGRAQYEGQYPTPQWSNAPLQTPQATHTPPSHTPSHPPSHTASHTPSHYAPPPSPQSSQYYRKNF